MEFTVKAKTERLRNYFVLVIGFLSLLGIVMVFSASYIYSSEKFGSSMFFLQKQMLFFIVAICIAFIVSKTRFNFWLKYSIYINSICSLFLLITLIPGLGVNIKGASRWVNLGFISFQPGELTKVSILLTSLYFFENFDQLDIKKKFQYGASLGIPLLFFLIQPDFGSFAICLLVMAFTCFISSFPRKYFYSFVSLSFITALFVMIAQPYRVRRLFTFLDPWKNPKSSGFQIIQSYLAFANGSFLGKGLGNSSEKLFYLPEAHNDFILSVIGEELGFVGLFLCVSAFIVFIYVGFKLAITSSSRKASIVISSIVFLIGAQAVINMGVVLGLLPTKGMNLPFISYGGSSLCANFWGVGLILSAVRFMLQKESLQRTSSFSEANKTSSWQNIQR